MDKNHVITKTVPVSEDLRIGVGCHHVKAKTHGLIALLRRDGYNKMNFHHSIDCCFNDVIFNHLNERYYTCGYNKTANETYEGVIVVFDRNLIEYQKKIVVVGPITCFERITVDGFNCVSVEGSVGFNVENDDYGLNNQLRVSFDEYLNVRSRRIVPVKEVERC